jgi:hypothetical protein
LVREAATEHDGPNFAMPYGRVMTHMPTGYSMTSFMKEFAMRRTWRIQLSRDRNLIHESTRSPTAGNRA